MQISKSLILVFISAAVISSSALAQIVELCKSETTPVLNGEYIVMSNVWGATTPQCLEVNKESTFFKVTLSGHDNGNSVAAYPSIYKGCHWDSCTTVNNPLPLQINGIESAPFLWDVTTSDAGGIWNTALDIWFAPIKTGSKYSAELMIWIDYHGGAMPGGTIQDSVIIGGYEWDIYFAKWDWNYIAYKITAPADKVNLDLNDFIKDSIKRGYLEDTWYMHAVEAGFEIFSGGQGLTNNSFKVDVIKK
ncbi:MAG: glycoside hydrolase [bacterium]